MHIEKIWVLSTRVNKEVIVDSKNNHFTYNASTMYLCLNIIELRIFILLGLLTKLKDIKTIEFWTAIDITTKLSFKQSYRPYAERLLSKMWPNQGLIMNWSYSRVISMEVQISAMRLTMHGTYM